MLLAGLEVLVDVEAVTLEVPLANAGLVCVTILLGVDPVAVEAVPLLELTETEAVVEGVTELDVITDENAG